MTFSDDPCDGSRRQARVRLLFLPKGVLGQVERASTRQACTPRVRRNAHVQDVLEDVQVETQAEATSAKSRTFVDRRLHDTIMCRYIVRLFSLNAYLKS